MSGADDLKPRQYGPSTTMVRIGRSPPDSRDQSLERHQLRTRWFLRVSSGAPLANPGCQVINQSWLGSFGNVTLDRETLRRQDYQIVRDGVLSVVGMPNGGGSLSDTLMWAGWNSIAVGTVTNRMCQVKPLLPLMGRVGRSRSWLLLEVWFLGQRRW